MFVIVECVIARLMYILFFVQRVDLILFFVQRVNAKLFHVLRARIPPLPPFACYVYFIIFFSDFCWKGGILWQGWLKNYWMDFVENCTKLKRKDWRKMLCVFKLTKKDLSCIFFLLKWALPIRFYIFVRLTTFTLRQSLLKIYNSNKTEIYINGKINLFWMVLSTFYISTLKIKWIMIDWNFTLFWK